VHVYVHVHVYVFLWLSFTSHCFPAVCMSVNSVFMSVYLHVRSVEVTIKFDAKMVQQQELKITFQSENFDRSFFHLSIEVKRRVSGLGGGVG
jgi:hypothetical protein